MRLAKPSIVTLTARCDNGRWIVEGRITLKPDRLGVLLQCDHLVYTGRGWTRSAAAGRCLVGVRMSAKAEGRPIKIQDDTATIAYKWWGKVPPASALHWLESFRKPSMPFWLYFWEIAQECGSDSAEQCVEVRAARASRFKM